MCSGELIPPAIHTEYRLLQSYICLYVTVLCEEGMKSERGFILV